MTLDDLRRPWIAEVSGDESATRMDELLSGMARVRRDVRMRDAWMVIPLLGLVCIVVFFAGWVRDTIDLRPVIAVLSVVACATVVTLVLVGARRMGLDDKWTVRARLEREIEWLTKQLGLLLTVSYWFLLPLFVAIVVMSAISQHERTGNYYPGTVLWVLYATYTAIAVLASWLCRREASRRFVPLLARLRELHRDLVNEADDSDR